MNQDHAIGGTAGAGATAMIATILQHFQGVDAATAAAEAGLIVLALGSLYGAGRAIFKRFYLRSTSADSSN